MFIEQVFGILKGRWQIIMKRTNVLLQHMDNVVSTCMVLQNICTFDGFDRRWIEEDERKLQRQAKERALREGQELKGEKATILEVRAKIYHGKNVTQGEECYRKIEIFFIKENEDLLHEDIRMHETIAKSL
jgi:hypothetical protein